MKTKQFLKIKNSKGFSLVELMIVVGIIGILATIAVPKFKNFQGKARMAEAKNMLQQIFTLEESYYADNGTYVGMATSYGNGAGSNCLAPAEAKLLGFEIAPCGTKTPRFAYTISMPNAAEFTATAVTGTGANNLVCPGLASTIQYTIDQTKYLQSNPLVPTCTP
ncbi:MAG: prepilin-type N-terminal cleavage/methylation domain-containing protein [Oligoflexales bacterium]|nr:prepilin-type N-terminal cleavage/methylation domain-containing protein [Oligoflexales bacterium]